MYSVSTVSLISRSHCCCSSRGPVSSPSSAQKMEKPALLSPSIRVLQQRWGQGRGERGRWGRGEKGRWGRGEVGERRREVGKRRERGEEERGTEMNTGIYKSIL